MAVSSGQAFEPFQVLLTDTIRWISRTRRRTPRRLTRQWEVWKVVEFIMFGAEVSINMVLILYPDTLA